MADIKPWYPTLETSKVFREHESPTPDTNPPLRIPDADSEAVVPSDNPRE